MIGKCPCMDCTSERSEGCHSICKKYKEWKAKYEEEKSKADKARQKDMQMRAYLKSRRKR